MATIPKKVIERFNKQVPRFKRILDKAYDKDINEADTVTIVTDILCEVFGYDRYDDITSEYAIRNTYCDLAVKIDDEVNYLIEVKSISTDLKEPHIRQAVNYGANEGIKWVILTNGYIWQVYNIQLKNSVQFEKVFEINFDEISPRRNEVHELLFTLSKEGVTKDVISEYQDKISAVNRYVISALIMNSPVVDCLRRELRKFNPGIKVEVSEIEDIIKNDVLKRNVIDDEKALHAQKRVKRFLSQQQKK
jgi:hypothetical protein